MGEKSKWFDPRADPPPLLQPVTSFQTMSRVSKGDCVNLLAATCKCGADPTGFFVNLARMPPSPRLRLNLLAVLNLLNDGSQELYTPFEVKALVSLSNRGVPTMEQETAYALLNTYERYQLQQSMVALFRDAHAQKFEDPTSGNAEDA